VTSINDQQGNGNPSDEPGSETAGEGRDAPDTINEGAQRAAGCGTIGAGAESSAAAEEPDQPPPPLAATADDRSNKGATASLAHGRTALALLRACLAEAGVHQSLERALWTIDAALRRAHGELTPEGDDDAPASVERRANGHDDDEEPPTSRIIPRPASMLAIRLNDRAILLTLEDADDRDLSGRQIIRCLVLTAEEVERALNIADSGLSAAAARIIASLPKGAS
jgi:hypothetical protein